MFFFDVLETPVALLPRLRNGDGTYRQKRRKRRRARRNNKQHISDHNANRKPHSHAQKHYFPYLITAVSARSASSITRLPLISRPNLIKMLTRLTSIKSGFRMDLEINF
jgi:hypothetical protein